jgi:hypothetical protein
LKNQHGGGGDAEETNGEVRPTMPVLKQPKTPLKHFSILSTHQHLRNPTPIIDEGSTINEGSIINEGSTID